MTVLVVGGTGRIGQSAVQNLNDKKKDVLFLVIPELTIQYDLCAVPLERDGA